MSERTEKRLRTANCYKLLAVFFYEPEIELWKQEKLCSQLAGLVQNISPAAQHMADRMAIELEGQDEQQLQTDYAALFLGPYDLIAPPYGSVYLENTKRIMGDSTMAVMHQYREAGLMLDIQEPADHIAIELEFMHYLSTLEADALRTGENGRKERATAARKKFLSAFLSPWVPPFCQNIRSGTENLFYRNLSDCLEFFIQADAPPMDPEKNFKENRGEEDGVQQPG